MFYIDEYNATAITDSVPESVKKITRVIPVIETDKSGQSFDMKDAYGYFWYLMGTTIGEHTKTFEKVLQKYNIQASGSTDVVEAVTDLYNTDKWKPFFADIQPLFADTIEDMAEVQTEKVSESGFVVAITAAIIGAVGAIAGGISSISASNKQKKGAEAIAKSNAMMGLSNVVAEKQKAQIDLEEAKAKERRLLIGGIIAFLLVLIIVAGIILIRRNKPAAA